MKDPTTFYSDIRQILQNARNRAYSEINRAMVEAYWMIGKRIVEEEQEGRIFSTQCVENSVGVTFA